MQTFEIYFLKGKENNILFFFLGFFYITIFPKKATK